MRIKTKKHRFLSKTRLISCRVGTVTTISRWIVCILIKDTMPNPFEGLSKPQPLKKSLSGYRSRRITDEHRFVYKIHDAIQIAQLHFQY